MFVLTARVLVTRTKIFLQKYFFKWSKCYLGSLNDSEVNSND